MGFNNCNQFECGYINKPYCSLRPITSITPCPRFSCPPQECFCPSPDCCFPQKDFCAPPSLDCRPNFPDFCCKPERLNPNLIWFLGGFNFGRRSNRFSEIDEF